MTYKVETIGQKWGSKMTYDCDLDVIKTSFSAQSSSRLLVDISKETASMWDDDDLFYEINDCLTESAEKNEFIIDEQGVMVCSTIVQGIDRPVHMFYRLSEPLKFKTSHAYKYVELIFVLLSPQEDGPLHLRRLSRITRLMQDQSFFERLREIKDKDAIRAQFMYPDRDIKAA